MRYIEVTLMGGQKVFINVNTISSVMSYPGTPSSIITCTNGKEFGVAETYGDIIIKIAESWGIVNNGK